MAQVRWPTVAAACAATAACAGSGDGTRAASDVATDSAVLAATAAGTPLRVSGVMIGRRIGAGNRVIEPTFEFATTDTVHVSVSTSGSGGDDALTAAWRSQAGTIVQQSSETPREGENTAFRLAEPKGLKPGTYKVVLFLGDDSVDTKVFVVKK